MMPDEVKDIRYFGSQTWPFPSNIMIGFRAEYASVELTPDGEEVVESGWFDHEHLPEIPRHGSIARNLLDAWAKGERSNRGSAILANTIPFLLSGSAPS